MSAERIVAKLLEEELPTWIGVTFGASGQPMANVGRDEVVLVMNRNGFVHYFVWSRFTHAWEAMGHFEYPEALQAILASLRDVRQVREEEIEAAKDELRSKL